MKNHKPYCLNCHQSLENDEKFCCHCGQEKKEYTLQIKEIGDQFFRTLFNIDNTLFRTLKLLPTPWVLTRHFVAGHRIPYYHPARMFIILLFLLFSVYTIFEKESLNFVMGDDYFYEEADFILKDSADALIKQWPALGKNKDSLYKALFRNKRVPQDTIIFEPFLSLESFPDIPTREVVTMDLKDLVKKYNIKGFWAKLSFEQSVKLYRNNAGFISYAIKNSLWAIPLSIILTSFFLFLIYYRTGYYYMEHATLLFHFHSTLFVFFILSVIITHYIPQSGNIAIMTGVCLLLLLPFISFYKYYGQGILLTLVKYVIYLVFYFLFLVIGILLVLIFSAILF